MVDIKKMGNISTVMMDEDDDNFEFMKTMRMESLMGLYTSAAGQFLMLKHGILQSSSPCKELHNCTTTMAVAWCVNSCSKAVIASYNELIRRSNDGQMVPELAGIKDLYEKCKDGGYLDGTIAPVETEDHQEEPVEGKDEIHEKKWKFGGYH